MKQHVDVGVDIGTLEDPQWMSKVAGRRLVPRPGRIAEMNFPARLTTEIDGTVYLLKDNASRGVGGLELELLDNQNKVVATTTSSWDGFYILTGVAAGKCSPDQLRRLQMSDTGMRELTVTGDGSFVSGIDLLIVPYITAKRYSANSPGRQQRQ